MYNNHNKCSTFNFGAFLLSFEYLRVPDPTFTLTWNLWYYSWHLEPVKKNQKTYSGLQKNWTLWKRGKMFPLF